MNKRLAVLCCAALALLAIGAIPASDRTAPGAFSIDVNVGPADGVQLVPRRGDYPLHCDVVIVDATTNAAAGAASLDLYRGERRSVVRRSGNNRTELTARIAPDGSGAAVSVAFYRRDRLVLEQRSRVHIPRP